MKKLLLFLSTIIEILYATENEKFDLKGTISVTGKIKSEYAKLAKISLQESLVIATKSLPGQVIEAVLDQEQSYLIYEIEIITTNQKIKEIIIDAGDGHVLLIKKEH